MDSIFVQIASYRDSQCGTTIKNLLSQARHPERLSFGVCLQWNFDDSEEEAACGAASLTTSPRVRIDAVQASESRGVCWARSRCQKLWQGESFTLQIDSHMRAEPGWDESLLACWRKTATPKAIISCYPNGFKIDPDSQHETFARRLLPIMAAKEFDNNSILRLQGISCFSVSGGLPQSPPPGAFISAGMLFGPASIITSTPYDPKLYFYGEESTYAARLWTAGYDIFNPDRLLLYHLYKSPQPQGRATTHWADHADWNSLNHASIERTVQLLSGQADLGPYGLGSERSLADYQEWSGVDFQRKTIADHAYKGLFGSGIAA